MLFELKIGCLHRMKLGLRRVSLVLLMTLNVQSGPWVRLHLTHGYDCMKGPNQYLVSKQYQQLFKK